MEWHVQHRRNGADSVVWLLTPEQAIETACRLMDDGGDVFGIGTGALTDSIGPGEIAKIYAMWSRARPAWGSA